MTEPDTTTMSGAEFQRHVGTDAQKWALPRSYLQRVSADWPSLPWQRTRGLRRKVVFRDYAEVCVNAAVRGRDRAGHAALPRNSARMQRLERAERP